MMPGESISVKPIIKLEARKKVVGDGSSGSEKGAADYPSEAAKSEQR